MTHVTHATHSLMGGWIHARSHVTHDYTYEQSLAAALCKVGAAGAHTHTLVMHHHSLVVFLLTAY